MNINVTIDELILEGVPLDRSQSGVLQAAVESELARLIALEGWRTVRPGDGGIQTTAQSPCEMQVPKGGGSQRLGQKIAQSVYRGIGK